MACTYVFMVHCNLIIYCHEKPIVTLRRSLFCSATPAERQRREAALQAVQSAVRQQFSTNGNAMVRFITRTLRIAESAAQRRLLGFFKVFLHEHEPLDENEHLHYSSARALRMVGAQWIACADAGILGAEHPYSSTSYIPRHFKRSTYLHYMHTWACYVGRLHFCLLQLRSGQPVLRFCIMHPYPSAVCMSPQLITQVRTRQLAHGRRTKPGHTNACMPYRRTLSGLM